MIPRMNHPTSPTDMDACYLALKARDARFDGCFFTGVTSTGIYCRPVCRVRTPKRENCRFFSLAAQAERAGFRPCLRCRPELAPRQPSLGMAQDKAWSMQDASAILATQAATLMDAPAVPDAPVLTVQRLAQRLGISDRHLRRIFEAQWGVSPLQYLQTRRLLSAKQLLTDTPLAVARVAELSGFASVRRFNAAFASHYGLNPTQLRHTQLSSHHLTAQEGLHVRLSYRPPYDVAALLNFLATRQITTLEVVDPTNASLGKTMALTYGQQRVTGWVLAHFDAARCRVKLQVSDSLGEVLPQVIARVRSLLDLDADPLAINSVLHADFPQGDGLRLPGTLDGFELAVRAVLGQQITVAAARTLAQRLVTRFGEPITTPLPGLTRLFPAPQTLAAASADELGALGIVKQRQAAIQALARAVASGQLNLDTAVNVQTTLTQLCALPGIGDWTANYIAMRALHWPDAFPAGDVALHKALGVQHTPHPAKAALAASQAWQPWRSYAVIRAWASLSRSGKNTQ
ncbi:MAG: AraC family transcriptional regulator [Comamonadaceae bacterium]|nr:MAG: AraC family transcriptional regulator [Comamonadaceae bacterium]